MPSFDLFSVRSLIMFCPRRIALLLAIALSSSLCAGCGPPPTQIRFHNETTNLQVGVSTDGTNTTILTALKNGDQTTLINNGGDVLSPGGQDVFGVAAGTYTVAAGSMTNPTGFSFTTETVTVAADQQVDVYIIADDPPKLIQFSSTP